MAKENANFGIRRRVTENYRSKLWLQNQFRYKFGNETQFKAQATFGLNVISKSELAERKNWYKILHSMGGLALAKQILKPIPPTASGVKAMKISKVDYFGGDTSKTNLALYLADEEGFLQAERDIYTQRVDELLGEEAQWRKLGELSIVIATGIPRSISSQGILEWFDIRMPPERLVHFSPPKPTSQVIARQLGR